MSDVERLLLDLLQIPPVERNKCIKSLLKILENIASNPNEPKYRDLKCNRVQERFNKCTPCFALLFCAGFTKSIAINKERLIWIENNDNFTALKRIIDVIKLNIIQTDHDKDFEEKKEEKINNQQIERVIRTKSVMLVNPN
eukprot:403650_1